MPLGNFRDSCIARLGQTVFHKKTNGSGPLAKTFAVTHFLTAVKIVKLGHKKLAQRIESLGQSTKCT